ncbi:MAG: hypothetical protein J6113_05960 [Lachnospiraceae bacterium]|nr:hypothetical protein [Lachnospiraceae bacterium]
MKIRFVLFICTLAVACLTACSETVFIDGGTVVPTEAPSQQETQPAASPTQPETQEHDPNTPTDTPAPTAETAETPAAKDNSEAIRIAELHGLSEKDLRGEYELFTMFSEMIEGNNRLNGYKEIVYRIFPVVADNVSLLDIDYFLYKLGYLTIQDVDLGNGNGGEFWAGDNLIYINTDFYEGDRYQYPAVVFHELMHFVDSNLSERTDTEYVPGVPVFYETDFLTEAGAELYTAKYFAKAVRAYFVPVQFLSGIDYIYGTETLNRIFFGTDSDAQIGKLFVEAGFSNERYRDAVMSLNWLTYPERHGEPDNFMHPEDILIDLYESKNGDKWKTDDYFLYILKTLGNIGISDHTGSKYESFLNKNDFSSWAQYEAFVAKLYAGLPELPDIRYAPPAPVILDGKPTLGAFAEWTDPDTHKKVCGTISAEYDFCGKAKVLLDFLNLSEYNTTRTFFE